MIKRIELRNFQRHEHLTVRPAGGVTVIVGQSHVGKSAIMRAVNWVVFNKPAGGSFIRHGCEVASVSIETEKGIVTRTRSTKGKNEYKIELPGLEPLIFTGFGQNVPSPVADFFELEEINFQPQMSLPFLICSSGGEISRKLNQIANLDKIDSTLAEIGRIGRQVTQSLASARARMEVAFSTVKSLTWLDNAEARLLQIEKTVSKQNALAARSAALTKAIAGFKKAAALPLEELQETIQTYTEAIGRGARIQEDGRDRDRLVTTYNQTIEAIEKVEAAREALTSAQTAVERAEKAYRDAFPDICPICGSPMRGPDAIHTHS
jgi:exonuclease SbcC